MELSGYIHICGVRGVRAECVSAYMRATKRALRHVFWGVVGDEELEARVLDVLQKVVDRLEDPKSGTERRRVLRVVRGCACACVCVRVCVCVCGTDRATYISFSFGRYAAISAVISSRSPSSGGRSYAVRRIHQANRMSHTMVTLMTTMAPTPMK